MPSGWAYFDTSVLVKRYIRESGTRPAQTLLIRHRLLTSALSPVEALSALFRRKNVGDLTDRNFKEVILRLRDDLAYWQFIEVGSQVLHGAEEVISKTGLRTLDAIHLSSALAFQTASGIQIPFITADEDQCQAAGDLNLEVVWVE